MEAVKMPDAPSSAPGKYSRARGEEVIEERENDEKRDADPEAPADQLLFDRQQRLGAGFLHFLLEVEFRHGSLQFSLRAAG